MEDQEALIILAEMLDKARIQANAIEATASQYGVYGKIVNALTGTLEAYCFAQEKHITHAHKIYHNMVETDNTVREAIKAEGV